MMLVKEFLKTVFGYKKPVNIIIDYPDWNGCCPYCGEDNIEDIGTESIAGIGAGTNYKCLKCHEYFIITDYSLW